MAIDTKNFFLASDIRTMQKDILELKKNGVLAIKKEEKIMAVSKIEPVIAPSSAPKMTTQVPVKPILPPEKKLETIPNLPKTEIKIAPQPPQINVILEKEKITPPQNSQPPKATFSSLKPESTTSPTFKSPMIKDATTIIQKPILTKEKGYLQGVEPAIKENLIASERIEKTQRKKFMEEVEEWAKNNTKY